ncbi:MAG: hypothetical protein ACP5HM_12380 [Anaerolineae bacterium]
MSLAFLRYGSHLAPHIKKNGTLYEEEVTGIETIVDAQTSSSTRQLLFELPPGVGDYKMLLTAEEVTGDVVLDKVTIVVKTLP